MPYYYILDKCDLALLFGLNQYKTIVHSTVLIESLPKDRKSQKKNDDSILQPYEQSKLTFLSSFPAWSFIFYS